MRIRDYFLKNSKNLIIANFCNNYWLIEGKILYI